MGIQDLTAASDANLAEFMLGMARAEAGATAVSDDLVLVSASHPNPGPYRNAALPASDALDPAEALARAREFFSGRSFVLWVRTHVDADAELGALVQGLGCTLLEEPGLPQLSREGPPDPVEPAPGVVVRVADDDESRNDFLQVNADAWGMTGIPLDVARRIMFEPGFLDDPTGRSVGVIAYLDGKPASTCYALVHPETSVGGYWGATAPWALGNRLLDLTTRTVYIEAFRRWPSARVSLCQNSPGSAKTLARMGFEPLSRYQRYLVPNTL